jgi:hypothetical protein
VGARSRDGEVVSAFCGAALPGHIDDPDRREIKGRANLLLSLRFVPDYSG